MNFSFVQSSFRMGIFAVRPLNDVKPWIFANRKDSWEDSDSVEERVCTVSGELSLVINAWLLEEIWLREG